MRRGLVFATDALEPIIGLSQQAEQAGFDRVWTTEYVGRDAVARAMAIGMRTEKIGVGSGIAYAFTRPPLAAAALAADAQRLTDGRFAYGVGSGTRGVRRWFGVPDETWEKPAPAMAGYADGVRKALGKAGDMPGAPELHGAALNPIMTKWVAGAYDGVLLHPLAMSRPHLAKLKPHLANAHATAMWVITSISSDESEAVERAKYQLAFYLTTPTYAATLEDTEWASVPGAIREAFDASDRKASWADLSVHVPAELVEHVCLAGTPDQVRAKAADIESELADSHITELVFQTVGFDITEAELITNCEQIIENLGGVAA